MIRAASAALALAAALGSLPGAANQPAPAIAAQPAPGLAWLHGEWEGEGIMLGQSTKVRLKVEPDLLGTATAVRYRADIPASATQPGFQFEGRGTYRVAKDGKVTGQWSDSQGNFHPLAGQVKGTALTVDWGEPRTEIGQSSYVLGPDGILTVTDSDLRPSGLVQFAKATYRRKS